MFLTTEDFLETASGAIFLSKTTMEDFHDGKLDSVETDYEFQIANLRYTRGITPKRVTSGGTHLRG